MDLHLLLGLTRRRWLPLLLSIVAGLSAAAYTNRSAQPIYASSARLFVSIESAGSVQEQVQGVQLTSQLLRSYAEVATSRRSAEQIKTALNLPEDIDAVRGKVSAQPQAETLLITVSATDPDPVRAASIANATATVLIATVDDLERGKASAVEARIIDSAVPQGSPISPKRRTNLLVGLFLGTVVGLGAALLLESLDRTVKTPAQASDLFGAPILGLIPRVKGQALSPVVTADDVLNPASEAYRSLRTAVRFVDPDRPLRTLLVTSPSAGEGKTTTAANLAIALAQSGERVLLVDADLRRARLGVALGLESAMGLTNLVTHRLTPDEALQGWRDLIAVIASGPLPPNPSELLGSASMASVVASLREMCDVVVFDAPPVLPVTDAVVLSTQVDGVILVARSGRTQRGSAVEARRRLDGVGANVIGCVLNAVPASAAQGYYEDYRYVAAPIPNRRWTDRLGGRRSSSR